MPTYRNRIVACALAACLALTSACTSPEEEQRLTLETQFSELMKRPDIETAIARYDQMLAEIRAALRTRFNMQEWVHEKGSGHPSPGCSKFREVQPWDAERQFMDRWNNKDPIPKEQWPEAITELRSIATRYGFVEIILNNTGKVRMFEIANHHDAGLLIGSGKATTMNVLTGCHLRPAAKAHGAPRSENPFPPPR